MRQPLQFLQTAKSDSLLVLSKLFDFLKHFLLSLVMQNSEIHQKLSFTFVEQCDRITVQEIIARKIGACLPFQFRVIIFNTYEVSDRNIIYLRKLDQGCG